MSEIFVCKKGSLTTASVRDLRKAGVLVVEADDPASCQFIKAGEVISSNDMLWAAMSAIQHRGASDSRGYEQREKLIANLFQLVDADRKKRSQDGATRSDGVDQ